MSEIVEKPEGDTPTVVTTDPKPTEEVMEESKVVAPEPVRDDSDLRESVRELSETVKGLVEAFASMSPLERDEAPAAVPWTHKGGRW